MKKEAKVEFGITITKPWNKEMYAHNEAVADVVRLEVKALLDAEVNNFLADFELGDDALALAWEDDATPELKNIQTAITCYGFGVGYSVDRVLDIVEQELEDAPLYRLNDIADELGLELEKGFVGFN
jgi:hypothetical protein